VYDFFEQDCFGVDCEAAGAQHSMVSTPNASFLFCQICGKHVVGDKAQEVLHRMVLVGLAAASLPSEAVSADAAVASSEAGQQTQSLPSEAVSADTAVASSEARAGQQSQVESPTVDDEDAEYDFA
jgi:hypothetical protein